MLKKIVNFIKNKKVTILYTKMLSFFYKKNVFF
jgi:hypothetical protein